MAEGHRQRVVLDYLSHLHAGICNALQSEEPRARFQSHYVDLAGGGCSLPMIISDGDLLEKAAIMLTHANGTRLPSAATDTRPELADHPFEAVSVSAIV